MEKKSCDRTRPKSTHLIMWCRGIGPSPLNARFLVLFSVLQNTCVFMNIHKLRTYRCCSVTKSCQLCSPTDCSTQASPSFTISQSLLKLISIESDISSSVLPFSSCPQSFPASGSFLRSQLFTSGDESIGASASASVLPMNTQD